MTPVHLAISNGTVNHGQDRWQTEAMPRRDDPYLGVMLGLVAGDALGTTLEFKPPGTFEPVTDIVGGGPFSLQPGQSTDDTSMALCLAESLVGRDGFDPVDQMQRYVRWYRHGHHSSTGRCFDIGNTVHQALHEFERTGGPYCGSSDPARRVTDRSCVSRRLSYSTPTIRCRRSLEQRTARERRMEPRRRSMRAAASPGS